MISGFHNSVNGDRRYLAEFLARFYGAIVADGVYPNPSSNFQLVEKENMSTSLRPGRIWIRGHFGYDDYNHDIVHDIADGVLNRIDRVVARLDFLERDIIIQVKKGVFASSPVAPALQRDANAWELALSDVRINAGTTNITQAQITDLRLNKELCGIAHGAVDQVDTTTLFNQYQSWLNEQKEYFGDNLDGWIADQQADFLLWLDSIKDILDENVAGNLLNMIEELAGQGRTTETVKGNADAINALTGLFDTLSTALSDLANKNATLEQKGLVQLNNSVTSTSDTDAATPGAVKKVMDAVNSNGYVTGIYTGDNELSQFINIGFTPSAVFVMPNAYSWGSTATQTFSYFALALNGVISNQDSTRPNREVLEVVQNGFKVFYSNMSTGGNTNRSLVGEYSPNPYRYIAFK